MPQENKIAIFFVNVSDTPVAAMLTLDARSYGLSAKELRVTKVTAGGPQEVFTAQAPFERELSFPPLTPWAWEIECRP